MSIYLDKTTSSVAALYGVWLAGGVAVPVNEGLRARQIEHIVRHSESRLFVSEPRKLARLDPGARAGADVLEVTEAYTRELPRPNARYRSHQCPQ